MRTCIYTYILYTGTIYTYRRLRAPMCATGTTRTSIHTYYVYKLSIHTAALELIGQQPLHSDPGLLRHCLEKQHRGRLQEAHYQVRVFESLTLSELLAAEERDYFAACDDLGVTARLHTRTPPSSMCDRHPCMRPVNARTRQVAFWKRYRPVRCIGAVLLLEGQQDHSVGLRCLHLLKVDKPRG